MISNQHRSTKKCSTQTVGKLEFFGNAAWAYAVIGMLSDAFNMYQVFFECLFNDDFVESCPEHEFISQINSSNEFTW